MRLRHRPVRRLLVAATSAALAATVIGPAPTAAGDDADAGARIERPPFYEPPAELPARAGAVIRSQPARIVFGGTRVPAEVRRIMYRSTDREGEPIAVTGLVAVPTARWTGEGKRPLVSYAIGTHGLGDRCAPSRTMPTGSDAEAALVAGLVAQGYAVAITDYEGLGTPGLHSYAVRRPQAFAVLDAARAAQRLPALRVPDDGPVAVVGYSQGGGAAAAAGELAPAYAPGLDLRGVAAGAVPAALRPVARFLDGGSYVAFAAYAVAGVSVDAGLDLRPFLNAKGERVLREVRTQCTAQSISRYAGLETSTLTTSGDSLAELLEQKPFAALAAQNRLGRGRAPEVPTLITHARRDDVIPFGVGRALAARWCGLDARVRFTPVPGDSHSGGAIGGFPVVLGFLARRFADRGIASTC